MKTLYTTLIQGPINEDSVSLQKINKYKEYGDVVVSCYNSDIAGKKLPWEDLKGTNIVTMCLPDIPDGRCPWLKESTFYYALSTMYNGLLQVKTPYVIKTRSDEKWGTFAPFIDEFQKDYDSLVCGNIFCRSFDDQPYHFGDHIFIIKTRYLKNAVGNLLKMYNKGMGDTSGAEIVLCKSIMNSMNIIINKKNYLNTVKVVDINKVKDFHVVWQHAGRHYTNSFTNHYGVYSNFDLSNK